MGTNSETSHFQVTRELLYFLQWSCTWLICVNQMYALFPCQILTKVSGHVTTFTLSYLILAVMIFCCYPSSALNQPFSHLNKVVWLSIILTKVTNVFLFWCHLELKIINSLFQNMIFSKTLVSRANGIKVDIELSKITVEQQASRRNKQSCQK